MVVLLNTSGNLNTDTVWLLIETLGMVEPLTI